MNWKTWSTAFLMTFAWCAVRAGAEPVPAGAPTTPYVAADKAYLFAHMKTGHYGVLYYAVSRDGLHWKALNHGEPVSQQYHGHASIARGGDGRYYLVGNRSDADPLIRFWVSDDLVTWKKFGTYQPRLTDIPGHPHALQRIGAPKLYFDDRDGRFLLTWHTPNIEGSPDDPERYWASQRTLYVVSPDLKTFADPPRRLFDWEMATIDTTIVRDELGDGYCALVKDERYPDYNWPTGKTVRISCGIAMTGPYPPPGPPLSPNFREAPTIIRSPDDAEWLLYYEQYAGTSYGLTKGRTLQGPWYQVSGNSGVEEWNRFEMVPGARHGSMLQISKKQYDVLVAAFGTDLGAPSAR
ncbi:family 43 glycosylhydrolase [Qipengyuania sp.]|uniref:family 43 glycosylhydrolase n=1 Tax=Qipengyuania sp. TaxID=2004515 RepID=UPI003AF96807